MNKKVVLAIVAVVIVAVGGLVWAMSDDVDTSTGVGTSMTTEQETSSDASSDAAETKAGTQETIITFTNNGFTPGSLSVKSGTVVTVKNDSTMNVQFSSDNHPSHTLNTEMNLKVLAPGESADFTAETVGTHGFHDHIDDKYTGTLIVTQ